MAKHLHPYPGPVFDQWGDATLAVTTTPVAGPNFPYTFILTTHAAGAVTVTMGSATATCNTPLTLGTPLPVPFDNPSRVYFKGTGNATVTFFGGR